MKYEEVQKKLLKFNSDPEAQTIREYYNHKSFLEILSKSRSETTHSAFLAWLLKGDGFGKKEDAPLMRFLDILVKNSESSDDIDSPCKTDESLKAAILSRTLEYSDVKTFPEQIVKDISMIPSRDRLDIYLTASLIKPIGEKKYLRIVIENKVFADEIRVGKEKNRKSIGGKMDDLSKVKEDISKLANFSKDDYLKFNQTERYYKAVEEYPKNEIDTGQIITLFVFLTPQRSNATDNHFIPVSYQDLMDFVLEPLQGNPNLDSSTKMYLQEYINALSVPSISDFDNEMTVLAVSNREKKKLSKFWNKYKDLITAAAESNKNESPEQPETLVLRKFYEKNQPLFIAIYHIIPEKATALKPYTTRDYTKYTLKFDGKIIDQHLGKRALVIAAFKAMKENSLDVPYQDSYNRVFYYPKDVFDTLHVNNEISEDAYNNRYTIVEIKKSLFAVCNQWGVGNWDWVEEKLISDARFELISEK
jgi:hypothetical protein